MRSTTTRLVVVTLVVLAVAATAVAGFLGYRYWERRATEDARDSSLASARSYAVTMFGYSPNTVESHVRQSKSILTGDALPTYDSLITKNNMVDEVRKQGIISEVTIQDAGVVTNDRNTSKVLIFMNQSVTRGDKQLVRVDPSRLTFSMRRDGSGPWMIDAIDVITDDSFRSLLGITNKQPANGVPLNPTPSAVPQPQG